MNTNKMPAAMRISLLLSICLVLSFTTSAQSFQITFDGSPLSSTYTISDRAAGGGVRKGGISTVNLLPGFYRFSSGNHYDFDIDAAGVISSLQAGAPLTGLGTSQLSVDPSKVHQIILDGTPLSSTYTLEDRSAGGGVRKGGISTVNLLPGFYNFVSGKPYNFEIDAAGVVSALVAGAPLTGLGTAQLSVDPSKVLQLEIDGSALVGLYTLADRSAGGGVRKGGISTVNLLPGFYRLQQVQNIADFSVTSDCNLTPPSPYLIGGIPVPVTCTSGTNTPPVADAGPDQTGENAVECTSPDGAQVTLDSSASSDPDDDDLTYTWTGPFPEGGGAVTGVSPAVSLPLGTHSITLTVDDGTVTDTDDVDITVEDTIAPTLTIPGDVTEECSAQGGQVVDIGSATGSDACGSVTLTNNAPALFLLGTTTVTWTADDGNGHTTSGTQDVTVVDTVAPSLAIPGDVTVECSAQGGQVVDIGQATATDVCDPNPSVDNDAPALFSLGTTVVTWEATDSEGNSVSGEQSVTVKDETPPVLTVPGDVTVECSGPNGQAVSIGTATATDICDPNPSVTSDAPALFSLGTTEVTWTATDASGNAISGTQGVTVQDTTPPEVDLNLTVTNLWPPNHKMHTVGGGSVSDICAQIGGTLTFGIMVTSNQPINGPGDGNTDPDWIATDNGDGTYSLQVRAERSGKTGERIYTIQVVADDGNGNTTTALGEVNVVHNQGKGKKNAKPVVVRKVEPGKPMQVGPSRQVVSDQTGVTRTVGESRQVVSSQTGVTRTVGESRQVGPPIESPIGTDVGNVDVASGADLTPEVNPALLIRQTPRFELTQNYPNPFNPATTIDYTLAESSEVQLTIYSVLGQQVKMLLSAYQDAGSYSVMWDGRDAQDREVTSGVYLYRLVAGEHLVVRKMVFAK